MLVRDVMTSHAHYCTLDRSAGDAARLMEELDIGCVPVVDDAMMPVAMVTDRDIALATYRLHRAPQAIDIRTVMSRSLFSCKPGDALRDAERTMRDWQVRRLPVIDEHNKLVGMLSLNDIVLASDRSTSAKLQQRIVGDLDETFRAVCRHRPQPVGAQF
jgi:CBS domain-containing protein